MKKLILGIMMLACAAFGADISVMIDTATRESSQEVHLVNPANEFTGDGTGLSNLVAYATNTLSTAINDYLWTTGRVWFVANGSDLQASHDAASDGDTLLLPSGTFVRTTTWNITKRLCIRGQGRHKTIISCATASKNVINITTNDVTIQDLSIETSGDGDVGIKIDGTGGNVLTGVLISGVNIRSLGQIGVWSIYGIDASFEVRDSVTYGSAPLGDAYGVAAAVFASAEASVTATCYNVASYIDSSSLGRSFNVSANVAASADMNIHNSIGWSYAINPPSADAGAAVFGANATINAYKCVFNGAAYDLFNGSGTPGSIVVSDCLLMNDTTSGTITRDGVLWVKSIQLDETSMKLGTATVSIVSGQLQVASPGGTNTIPYEGSASGGTSTNLSDYNDDVGFLKSTDKGITNGVASLDGTAKIPFAQIPAIAVTDVYVVDETNQVSTVTNALEGDVLVVLDISGGGTNGNTYIATNTALPSTTNSWVQMLTPADAALQAQINLKVATTSFNTHTNLSLASGAHGGELDPIWSVVSNTVTAGAAAGATAAQPDVAASGTGTNLSDYTNDSGYTLPDVAASGTGTNLSDYTNDSGYTLPDVAASGTGTNLSDYTNDSGYTLPDVAESGTGTNLSDYTNDSGFLTNETITISNAPGVLYSTGSTSVTLKTLATAITDTDDAVATPGAVVDYMAYTFGRTDVWDQAATDAAAGTNYIATNTVNEQLAEIEEQTSRWNTAYVNVLIPMSTNATYDIVWMGPWDNALTLDWMFAKTDNSTCVVWIVEQATNAAWNTYTTNAVLTATTVSVKSDSFTDATIGVGNLMGIRTPVYNAACTNVMVRVKYEHL